MKKGEFKQICSVCDQLFNSTRARHCPNRHCSWCVPCVEAKKAECKP